MEDAYSYYVCILGISEDLFWDADISFVKGVVENKAAFDGWENSERRKMQKRMEAKAKRKR